MKKLGLFIILTISPIFLNASNTFIINKYKPNIDIPNRFISSSKTDTLEWGCPISDTIEAASSADAIQKMGQVCMDDVRKAAIEKPGVFEVIRISILWPDVAVSQAEGRYRLEGTIFLETLVMKGQETK
jgi:hypothetical protein